MEGKRVRFLAVVLVLFIFLSGCSAVDYFTQSDDELQPDELTENGQPGEENLRETVFYYVFESDYLIPVLMNIPWTEGIARAAINRIIKSPEVDSFTETIGLQAPLPQGTEILGLNIRDGLARIDLSEELLNVQEGKERIAIDSVAYTLMEFSTVDEVEILVEGKLLEEFPKGVSLEQPLNRSRGINLEVSEGVQDMSSTSKVQVYFCGRGEEVINYFVPVTRVIPRTADLMEAALNELIKGPKPGTSLFSEINSEVTINSFSVKDGLAAVDFSKEFASYHGGVTSEENILKQVTLTLTQFPEVSEVLILVDGQQPELTWEQPLKAPEKINIIF